MPSFRYQYGDRPLEGFTIQHGVGRGGFGEVYFAISDTGREVALKSVQQYEEIELRGIGHCMNLKSPHLISIFDVRHSVNREPFVIMEYVNGPSLRDILDEAPHGLGTVKAVYLLREIAKGLSFLHQNGVVHRDLKPHNVFIEQGLVKIGDYSLSKIMTASHRSGHTVTVGTVHYMAPEIGLGRYDHTVDIYALGVVFYEMLTGVPPFRGDSVGEVLMKHVAGDPELSHIAQPLANVIRKAMNKDPRQRFQSVEQMVADVLGCAGVDAGLANVSADDLSMIAKRELRSTAAPLKNELPPQYSAEQEFVAFAQATLPERAEQNAKGGFFHHMNLGLSQLCSAIGLSRRGWPDYWGPVKDPVDRFRRWLLAFLAIAFFVIIPTVFFQSENVFGVLSILVGGGSLVLLMSKWLLLPALESNASTVYRFLFGIIGSAFMIVSSMMLADFMRGRNGDLIVATGCFCCIPLWLIDWRVMSSPIRPQRLSFTPVIGVALLAVFPPAMWVIAGIAVAVQLGSKYDPALSQRFGLNFPWFQHFLSALRSLAKPRPRTVPTALQYARSPAAAAPLDQVVPPSVVPPSESTSHDPLPQGNRVSNDWQFPGKVAATLYKIPVNQYSAVIADSLVKAGGSVKRFVVSSTCLLVIGSAWLILLSTNVGVPQLMQNTIPQRELADIEYVFGQGDWSAVVIRLARMVALLLALPSIALLLKIRFNHNRERGIQTVIAFSLLGVSLLVLGESFGYGSVWGSFGTYVRGGEQGYAVNRLLDEISLMGIFFGLLIAIFGLYFLLVGFRSKPATPAAILPTSDNARTTNDPAEFSANPAHSEVSESDIKNKTASSFVS
jgi:Protein kinase domain